MRLKTWLGLLILASALPIESQATKPTYDIDQAVALARTQNPEIIIARKQVEAALGDLLSARSGYLPSVISTGLVDKRQQQRETTLRDEDYSASLRLLQNLYT